MKKQRIAVIGAGLAGLTCAWRLKQNNFDPVVFEAKDQPGGRARSIHEEGAVHDLGAWTFTSHGSVIPPVKELGLTKEMVGIPAALGRPVNGKLKVADLRKPLSLIGTVFNLEDMFSAAKMKWIERLPSKRCVERCVRMGICPCTCGPPIAQGQVAENCIAGFSTKKSARIILWFYHGKSKKYRTGSGKTRIGVDVRQDGSGGSTYRKIG
jgi:hypothetical protein